MRVSWGWPPAAMMQVGSGSSGSERPDSGLTVPVEGILRGAESGVRDWIQGVTGMGPETQNHLVLSLLAITFIYAARKLILRIVDRRVDDPRLLYQWSKISSHLSLLISFLLVGTIWFEGLRSLGTFLGLLSAGLAIALKDVVTSLAGWLFIILRRPFQLGDRIQIGTRIGDVVDIRIFQFTILEIGNWVNADQSTGRIIHVPNSLVFSEPVSSYTAQFEFIWNEIPVLLTFESNWKKAKAILEGILEEKVGGIVAEAARAVKSASRKYLIHFKTLTPKVYTSVEDSGVLLTLRFLCPVRERRGRSEALWEAILDAFAQEDEIDFAYPTTRMYHNIVEGKGGARAPLPPTLGGGAATREGG